MTRDLDGVPGGVLGLSADLHILDANATMGDLIGRSPSALLGEPLDSLLSAPSRILFQTHVFPVLAAHGRVEEVFLTLVDATGVPVPVLLNAARSEGPAGQRFDVLVVRVLARTRWETELLAGAQELARERAASQALASDLQRAVEDLSVRHEQEQRSHAVRDAFLGVLSHELGTPITTIYGMSQLLTQRLPMLDVAVATEYVEEIHAESERLRRLMGDLIVLSRAEAGSMVLEAEPVLVHRVVSSAVQSERARALSHRFIIENQPGLPLIMGEETYLEQVIRNYLSNAVKYSPAGSTILVRSETDAGGVVVRVLDEGAGLGSEEPDRLFELFYRAPGAAGKAPGSGIGLFVCRQLIEAMRGRTWARSNDAPNTGAEFGFWLPAMADLPLD